jgi:colanic acid biosynthesis glycosyl transferase WcaI
LDKKKSKVKYLFITQSFYPDTVSVSQHVSDLAFELAKENEVSVISSAIPYEKEETGKYPSKEIVKNVSIVRLVHPTIKSKSILSRYFNTLIFYLFLISKLVFYRKYFDKIVFTSMPPMLSFIVTFFYRRNKKAKRYYWYLDAQPGLAFATGIIKEKSFKGKILSLMNLYSLRKSDRIIVLDSLMKEHLVRLDLKLKNKIDIVTIWPLNPSYYNSERESNPFRVKNKFGSKIVLMYSGNHALVHPIETILKSSISVKRNDIIFCFIGNGIRKKEVDNLIETGSTNVISLPFQSFKNFPISLASADYQIVIMGNNLQGLTHPNKIYAALFAGKPVLYIGPKDSHISRILNLIDDSNNLQFEHGEHEKIINALEKMDVESIKSTGLTNRKFALENFSRDVLMEQMIKILN